MKITLPLLLGAVFASSAFTAETPAPKPATLDDSEVRITYAELKKLLAAAQPPAATATASKPPLPAALLSAVWTLDVQKGRLTAEMSAQSFIEGWQCIPLAGADLGAIEVQPPDTRLVVQNDHLCLLTEKIGPQTLTLTFPFRSAQTITLAPSALAELEISALPEKQHLRLQSGSSTTFIRESGRHALPASGVEVTLSLESDEMPAIAATANDDAILTTATYTTQVVRDGSVLTEGTLLVRHDPPLNITVMLPEAARLLQCHVNGELIRPAVQNGTQIDIPLHDPATDGGESKIELSFTSTLPALQATEGEIELALPRTALFARQIDWQVRLPESFDLAASGNVEPQPATEAKTGLNLRKSLCRDQQPQARITYRKRSN